VGGAGVCYDSSRRPLTRTAILGALALLFLVVGCKPNGVLKHPTVLPIRISLGWTWQIRIRAGVESQVRVEVSGLNNVESHVRVKGSTGPTFRSPSAFLQP
jgi:hypothetical protein